MAFIAVPEASGALGQCRHHETHVHTNLKMKTSVSKLWPHDSSHEDT